MRVLGFSGLDNSIQFKREHFPSLAEQESRIVQGLDSAAALIDGGVVTFAAAEERFSREKATGAFPVQAIRCGLAHASIVPEDIDVVAHCFDYGDLRPFFEQEPLATALYDEVYAPARQVALLDHHFPAVDWTGKFVSVPHHLAHAASAFYQSGFGEALILVSDAMGEMHSASVLVGSGPEIRVIAQIPAAHSLGVLYSVFTMYLGFQFNMDEYKVMGLAPYGDARRYFRQMMEMVSLRSDGTYTIPVLAEDRSLEEQFTYRNVLGAIGERFGPPRAPNDAIDQRFKDVAAALQSVLQTTQLHVLRHFRRETGLRDLCMAGGVSLNCTSNGVIKRSRLFRDVFVQPAAGDDGAALGAALYVQHQQEPRVTPRRLSSPLWGPEFDRVAIADALEGRTDCATQRTDSFETMCREIARRLADGQIVGWFQGRMEFGPRALGSRSILADPRGPDVRARVNMLVKKREGFRPFAPAVVVEAASEYFEMDRDDEGAYAHMLFVTPVREHVRELLPAVTHVDGSARLQTVSREYNPQFWTLLTEFGRLTGTAILLNTSFNVRGQPIVCTPTEAIDTFLLANLDALALGDYLVTPASR